MVFNSSDLNAYYLYIFLVGGCDFDIDSCYWQHFLTDKFDWVRKSGQTDSALTGPSGDHTSGKGKLTE